ncbi:hypothetical protein ACIA5C_10525 [Actinoplanes sp. NPDC051343]|uniref:hypothetical protein n=1 Tax=Actinoplanes sp. NPDC051343 TaxID=3363906 RepID=UPI0037A22F88
MAAEAFLLTIALAPDSSVAARIMAWIVGLLVALLASQFMATHRHASQRDGRILQELVDRLGLQPGRVRPSTDPARSGDSDGRVSPSGR